MKVLSDAKVSTGGRREKAKAILEAFRKKVPYISDPVLGEFMATPNQTLCLDEDGICFIGGDCDDMAIGLAAAMMSIGIPAMIVGASYHDPIDVPTHVFMAFQDDLKSWVRMDGTTQLPVGGHSPSAREFWIEPGAEAKEAGKGDFVGMSGGHGMLAKPVTMLDLRYPNVR